MIRNELKKKNDERLIFNANVERFGQKKPYRGWTPITTVCLSDVKFSSGELATDHIWFEMGKRFSDLNLNEGDSIQFEARISKYIKGYVSYREGIDYRSIDYKLNNPTKIRKLN